MKPDLSYEQCRDLEKWGLDQTLEKGDWILIEDGGKWVGYLISIEDKVLVSSVLTRSAGEYVKLSSAEEMIMLLRSRGEFGALGYLEKSNEWYAETPLDSQTSGHRRCGDSPTAVLYALCEKVFGKEGQ